MIDRELLKERLVRAYEYLKDNGLIHSKSDLARTVGIRINNLNDAFGLRGNYMNESLLTRVADAFPDVLNREYLLTGEGDVAAPDRTLRPHFEAKASAGFMSAISEGEAGVMLPRIPGVKDYDFTITAEGESMLPRIESGDLLLCRRAGDRANIPLGRICVIDGKDGAAVKVIAEADDECVTLHSLNPDYKDYRVEFADILGIAEVVGLVRSF